MNYQCWHNQTKTLFQQAMNESRISDNSHVFVSFWTVNSHVHWLLFSTIIKRKKRREKKWTILNHKWEWRNQSVQAPFCGRVSKADTVFSNLIRCRGAPLCLMAHACLSSNGQRAFSMENTWLFNRLAFFIASNRASHPF